MSISILGIGKYEGSLEWINMSTLVGGLCYCSSSASILNDQFKDYVSITHFLKNVMF